MLVLNNLVAKTLSKVFKGTFGTIVHFFVMGFIYRMIMKVLYGAIMTGGNFLFSKEQQAELELLSKQDPTAIFKEPKIIGIFIVLGIIYIVLMILQWVGTAKASKIYKQARDRKYQTFGKARFSEVDEVIKAGLQGAGIVFGKMGRKLITKPPKVEGHSLIVGCTGTGKSRGIVIPSLLMWQGSAIVMDIKGELSKITAERRAKYGKVYIFNPEGEGACYDPVRICSTVDQAQDLARTLIPLPEKGEPFWSQSAQAILSAFVYEGAVKGYKLTDIAERLCTSPITELVEHCRNHEIREVKILASITYDLPEKTLGGVMGEL